MAVAVVVVKVVDIVVLETVVVLAVNEVVVLDCVEVVLVWLGKVPTQQITHDFGHSFDINV